MSICMNNGSERWDFCTKDQYYRESHCMIAHANSSIFQQCDHFSDVRAFVDQNTRL